MTSYEERLETVPSHPEQAESYPQLLALWKALRAREDPDPAELAEWDRLVMALLTIDERGYYLDEKRLVGATAAAGKVNRLSGILLGRHNPPPGLSRRASSPPEREGAPQRTAAEQQVATAEQEGVAAEQEGAAMEHQGEATEQNDATAEQQDIAPQPSENGSGPGTAS